MIPKNEHDKTLQGIRNTIEELKAEIPPQLGSSAPHQEKTSRTGQSQPSPAGASAPGAPAEKTIPVIEERPVVGKQLQEKAQITFRKQVHEEEITVDDHTTEEEVHLQRVPVQARYVDENPPAPRQEGDTIIIPVFHEVVEKQLILVEEVRITRHKKHSQSSHPVTLHKEEVRLTQDPSPGSSAKGDFENRNRL